MRLVTASPSKVKIFNFLLSCAMEFTTGCYTTPQMPHARRKCVDNEKLVILVQ